MLKVLEHILVTWPAARPEHKVFNEAIKDLQAESMNELHRLAAKMPDHLLVSAPSYRCPVSLLMIPRLCTTKSKPR
jgi:hypothetical protein